MALGAIHTPLCPEPPNPNGSSSVARHAPLLFAEWGGGGGASTTGHGSSQAFAFVQAISKYCEVHSFDPTPHIVAMMKKIEHKINWQFHPWGLDSYPHNGTFQMYTTGDKPVKVRYELQEIELLGHGLQYRLEGELQYGTRFDVSTSMGLVEHQSRHLSKIKESTQRIEQRQHMNTIPLPCPLFWYSKPFRPRPSLTPVPEWLLWFGLWDGCDLLGMHNRLPDGFWPVQWGNNGAQ